MVGTIEMIWTSNTIPSTNQETGGMDYADGAIQKKKKKTHTYIHTPGISRPSICPHEPAGRKHTRYKKKGNLWRYYLISNLGLRSIVPWTREQGMGRWHGIPDVFEIPGVWPCLSYSFNPTAAISCSLVALVGRVYARRVQVQHSKLCFLDLKDRVNQLLYRYQVGSRYLWEEVG